MGNSVGATISRQCARIATEVAGASRTAVAQGSLIMKTGIERELKAIVPDLRMSGVGKSGAKIGVRFDIKGKTNPTSIVMVYGPAHLLERDTDAHWIVARRLSTRSSAGKKAAAAGTRTAFGASARGQFGTLRKTKSGKRALTIGGNPRAYARHPGTAGQGPFEKGIRRSTPAVVKVLNDVHSTAFLRGLKAGR